MRTFAIGDVQGCFRELSKLLQSIHFNADSDRVWFVGDLVNRGPQSADVLRLVRDLGDAAVTVLGNHDLHLLAVAHGFAKSRKLDTLDDVLRQPDADDLVTWLMKQPLLHFDPAVDAVMVHAGIYPGWSLDEAIQHAEAIQCLLSSGQASVVLSAMYGNKPRRWSADLPDDESRRFIINAFTRMRYCNDRGELDLKKNGPPEQEVSEYRPWFKAHDRVSVAPRIVFGHWSSLGAGRFEDVIALDSGCVWGNGLTAVRLDENLCEFSMVPSLGCGTID